MTPGRNKAFWEEEGGIMRFDDNEMLNDLNRTFIEKNLHELVDGKQQLHQTKLCRQPNRTHNWAQQQNDPVGRWKHASLIRKKQYSIYSCPDATQPL